MGYTRKDLKVIGLAAVLLALLYFGIQSRAQNPETDATLIASPNPVGIEIGNMAPGFSLQDLDGKTIRLGDYRGKGVVINFWATWCPPCREEMPILEKTYRENSDELIVLGVNLQEKATDVEPFVRELGLTFPILLDPSSVVKDAYNVWTQPVTYFVDRNGAITAKKFGPLTEEELASNIEKMLEVRTTKVDLAGEEIMITNGVKHIVPLEKIRSGGPPKDGIPAIDSPKFVSTAEAAFLSDDDAVLGLHYQGVARVYPLKILNWHEIVNDFVGGEPVLITYCPLCGSGIAFERKINGEAVEFGVSGKLYNSDLVMYDRKTDTYWDQITGRAIVGELSGMRLKRIPIDTVKWGEWKATHPDTVVLSIDTGFRRNYNVNPYFGYDESKEIYFSVESLDERLHPKAVVYGVELEGNYVAFPDSSLAAGSKVEYALAGKTVVVEKEITGGVRISVKENGNAIAPVRAFWFAWAAFHPDTELYQP